jgi:hypothetical protein
MPGNPSLKLVPDYASDIVGGAIHHGSPASRTEWPYHRLHDLPPQLGAVRASLEPADVAQQAA